MPSNIFRPKTVIDCFIILLILSILDFSSMFLSIFIKGDNIITFRYLMMAILDLLFAIWIFKMFNWARIWLHVRCFFGIFSSIIDIVVFAFIPAYIFLPGMKVNTIVDIFNIIFIIVLLLLLNAKSTKEAFMNKAIQSWDKAISSNPNYVKGMVNMGKVYKRKGDREKAKFCGMRH